MLPSKIKIIKDIKSYGIKAGTKFALDDEGLDYYTGRQYMSSRQSPELVEFFLESGFAIPLDGEEKNTRCTHPTCYASADGRTHTRDECANSIECCHNLKEQEPPTPLPPLEEINLKIPYNQNDLISLVVATLNLLIKHVKALEQKP